MPEEFETPADFPDLQDVAEGDTKKFIIEAKCTGKQDDGEMEWQIVSIDGVKLPEDSDEMDEKDQGDTEDDGMDSNYDTSQDEEGGTEDMTDEGKPKTTKGVAMLILHGKPGK